MDVRNLCLYFSSVRQGGALNHQAALSFMTTKQLVSIGMVSAALVGFGSARAQTNTPAVSSKSPSGSASETDPESPINLLGRELNLNRDQKAKVQAVFEETRSKIQAAVQQAMTNADSQLHHILTPDQYRKLQRIEQEHQSPGVHPQSGAESRPEESKAK